MENGEQGQQGQQGRKQVVGEQGCRTSGAQLFLPPTAQQCRPEGCL